MIKKLQFIQLFDIITSSIVIAGLCLIPVTKVGWAIYSFGCLCYMIITYNKRLWGGITLNFIAMVIGTLNYFK